MNTAKKLPTVVSVILIAILILVFASCGKNTAPETSSQITGITPTTEIVTNTDGTLTALTTLAPTTAAPVTTSVPLDDTNSSAIIQNGRTKYRIVYPKDTEKLPSNRLARSFKRFTSASPNLIDDSKAETSYEIIVGKASRDGVKKSVVKATCGYEYKDGKVYIYGFDDTCLLYAVEHFVENYVKNAYDELRVNESINYEVKLTDYKNGGWRLNIPSFDKGTLYDKGYNCGSGLLDDTSNKTTIENSYMQLITGTTKEHIEEYFEKLEKFGYKREYYHTIEKNIYARYTFGDLAVYAYFIENTKTTRVIEDRTSNVFLEEVMRKTETPTKNKVEFYQYSLDYKVSKEDSSGEDSGMFYIIKLADSSLILVDGGHNQQASSAELEGMYKFLYKITGKKETEKLDIAAWYITHPHGDHVRVCHKLLDYFNSRACGKPNIGAFIFNFPSQSNILFSDDGRTKEMRAKVMELYPDAKYLKISPGMVLKYPGFEMEVVFTHEMLFTTSGYAKGGANNGCSMVMLKFNGCQVALLGDVEDKSQAAIMSAYSSDYLKSDMIQVAHHGYAGNKRLCDAIRAPYAVIPNSQYSAHSGYSAIGNVKTYAGKNMYYAGDYTYKFTWNGTAFDVERFARLTGN